MNVPASESQEPSEAVRNIFGFLPYGLKKYNNLIKELFYGRSYYEKSMLAENVEVNANLGCDVVYDISGKNQI